MEDHMVQCRFQCLRTHSSSHFISRHTMKSHIHNRSVHSCHKDPQNVPVYGKHPRQLIIYDHISGDWLPNTDPAIIVKTPYLAVSYRQIDFPDQQILEDIVQGACDKYEIKAYWLDFACTGNSQEEKNQDLYRIADVFRYATLTLIVIKGQIDTQLSEGWLSWGSRKWTLPEALLSKKFACKIGKRLLVTMDLRSVANHAYFDDDDENVLIALYDTHGKDFLADFERVELLCKAIKSRSSGSCPSTNKIEGEFTAYPAEWVYALMGFFLHRIQPTPEKTEKEAFMELLDVNGLECDESQWEIFSRSDGKEKIGIRVKGSRSSDRIDDADLPKYVAAAKFDHGQTVRTVCEKGTREETLADVYDWLDLGSNSAVSHTRNKPILWLNGLAGSGKSTIAQTAARRCDDEYILGGTFFCSRYSVECSDVFKIFATIAYELGRFNADFKRRLSEIYCKDRNLQRAQPERQLRKLIIEPLRSVPNMQRCVVIIDALDECSDSNARSVILEALDEHRDKLAPLKFLITSRPDQNIKGAFLTLSLSEDTENLDLNKVNPEQTKRDIRAFLAKRLSDLALARGLKTWPSTKEIDALVELSNGLFIFASTTVKFLSHKSAASMKGQLETLLSSKAPISDSPYKHLDLLYLQVFGTAFGEISDKLKDRLQTVLGSLVLSQQQFSITGLGNFLEMSVEDIHETLHNLHSLVVLPDDDAEYIRLIHPSIYDFLTNAERCIDPRFIVKETAGHSNVVKCCLKRLVKFTTEEMQSCETNISEERWDTLIYDLVLGDDAALTYAHRYLTFHINKSEGQLDELVLQLLGELLSKQCVLDIIVYDGDEAIFLFLNLLNKLSCWPSPPSGIMKQLYEAAIFLCRRKWHHIRDIEKYAKSIKDARTILQMQFSYKDGLYSLDLNFSLLPIDIVGLSDFSPFEDDSELKNEIHELRNHANSVHKLITQQIIPEDESVCSVLRESLSTLYKELKSNYASYRISMARATRRATHRAANLTVLHSALPCWIKSLKDFQAKVHKILGISDDIEPSELPRDAIIDMPDRTQPFAMISELSNKYNNNNLPVARTSCSDAGEGRSASSSYLPARLLLNIPPASRHPDELESHEPLVANKMLYNAPDVTFSDVSAVNYRDTDDTKHVPAALSSAKRSRLSPAADSPDWKRLRTD